MCMGLLLMSCSQDEEKEDKEGKADEDISQTIRAVETCDCGDLIVQEQDGKALKGTKAFTGACFSNYPNVDQKYEERIYKAGELVSITYFDKVGQVLTHTDYEDGKAVKDRTTCGCDELEYDKLMSASLLDDKRFSGVCRSYYPNSEQIYLQERYRNGIRHGYSTMYDKQGHVLMLKEYENGKLVSEETFASS